MFIHPILCFYTLNRFDKNIESDRDPVVAVDDFRPRGFVACPAIVSRGIRVSTDLFRKDDDFAWKDF